MAMSGKRRVWGAALKAKVALAALKGDKIVPVNYSGTQDERDAYKLAHMGLTEARMRKRAVLIG